MLQRLLLGKTSRRQVTLQILPQVIIHSAVIQHTADQAVQPRQLQSLPKGHWRLPGDLFHHLGQILPALSAKPVPILPAHPGKGIQSHAAGFIKGYVPSLLQSLFLQAPNLLLHSPKPQMQQLIIVQISPHHSVQRKSHLRMLPIDILRHGFRYVPGIPAAQKMPGFLGLPVRQKAAHLLLPGLVRSLRLQGLPCSGLIMEKSHAPAQKRLIGKSHRKNPQPSRQRIFGLYRQKHIPAHYLHTFGLPDCAAFFSAASVHLCELLYILIKCHILPPCSRPTGIFIDRSFLLTYDKNTLIKRLLN
ncbi:hypothetical protein IMSAG025_01252 [Muribaculaceae bacterium]|nr:hypothetical protein IMSAG025_01252 [Muribaculaceae bacterium]